MRGGVDDYKSRQRRHHPYCLGATAGAYFSRETWPEWVWAAGNAYARYLSRHPTIAHFGFVETYPAGTRAAEQTDKAIKAFTVFLYEGQTHTRAGRYRPSPLALDAIAATIFDLAAHETLGLETAQPCRPCCLKQSSSHSHHFSGPQRRSGSSTGSSQRNRERLPC
jgi:hypothetical protein